MRARVSMRSGQGQCGWRGSGPEVLSIYLRSGSEDSGVGGGLEIKVCPRCSVLIVKMDDGK